MIVTASSGNVFKDANLPYAEESAVKSDLAHTIQRYSEEMGAPIPYTTWKHVSRRTIEQLLEELRDVQDRHELHTAATRVCPTA